MPEHFIAYWTAENLFDVEDAPPDRRPDKVRRALKVGSASSEVKGWTQEHERRTRAGRAGFARGGEPPRPGTGIVHAYTRDERGIDEAFLYDTAVLRVNRAEVIRKPDV